MKTLFIIIATTIILSVSSKSFEDLYYRGKIKTGSTPSQIYSTNVGPVVYCAGIDANFNGVQDDGDEPPSLWLLEQYFMTFRGMYIAEESVKLTDLDFKIPMLPIRNYFDESTKRLYIANANSIDTISFAGNDYTSMVKGRLLDDISDISAISAFNDKVFISVRPSIDKGLVYVYDIPSRKITDTIEAGAGVQMTKFLDAGDILAILCEGTFGNNDGKFIVAKFLPGDSVLKFEIPVGGTPNHFLYGSKLIVTCNASHEVLMLDFETQKIDTVKFPTTGYDGPRETIPLRGPNEFGNSYGITTAYNGNIYFTNNDGIIVDSLDAHGKAESVYSYFDLIIATPFMKDTYTPDTAVTVYGRPESVDENRDKLFSIFPNPAVSRFNLMSIENEIVLGTEIVNILGVKVAEYSDAATDGNYEFNLPAGKYFVRVRHQKGITTLPLTVVK